MIKIVVMKPFVIIKRKAEFAVEFHDNNLLITPIKPGDMSEKVCGLVAQTFENAGKIFLLTTSSETSVFIKLLQFFCKYDFLIRENNQD